MVQFQWLCVQENDFSSDLIITEKQIWHCSVRETFLKHHFVFFLIIFTTVEPKDPLKSSRCCRTRLPNQLNPALIWQCYPAVFCFGSGDCVAIGWVESAYPFNWRHALKKFSKKPHQFSCFALINRLIKPILWLQKHVSQYKRRGGNIYPGRWQDHKLLVSPQSQINLSQLWTCRAKPCPRWLH